MIVSNAFILRRICVYAGDSFCLLYLREGEIGLDSGSLMDRVTSIVLRKSFLSGFFSKERSGESMSLLVDFWLLFLVFFGLASDNCFELCIALTSG